MEDGSHRELQRCNPRSATVPSRLGIGSSSSSMKDSGSIHGQRTEPRGTMHRMDERKRNRPIAGQVPGHLGNQSGSGANRRMQGVDVRRETCFIFAERIPLAIVSDAFHRARISRLLSRCRDRRDAPLGAQHSMLAYPSDDVKKRFVRSVNQSRSFPASKMHFWARKEGKRKSRHFKVPRSRISLQRKVTTGKEDRPLPTSIPSRHVAKKD